ncbi:MAG TPA: hypothetical protein VNJ11_08080 [Bryobacteraceae bacterium]|nr:hypothetical protein [Bryobacteraceae bacterium]
MKQARKQGAEGMAGEANYRTRLEAARSLFRDLAKRAEAFAARLEQIRDWVEERQRLEAESEEQRLRRARLHREIESFYAGWRQWVAEARAACGRLRGLLPAHEVERFAARLSETAIGPSLQALQELLGRLEEFLAASKSARARFREPRKVQAAAQPTPSPPAAERWVTASEYAAYAGVSVQTLANWRWQDRKAGRDHAAPRQIRLPPHRTLGAVPA